LFQNTDIIYSLEESSHQSLQFGDNNAEFIQEIFVPNDIEPQSHENFGASSSQHFTLPSHISPTLSTSASLRNSNYRSKKKVSV